MASGTEAPRGPDLARGIPASELPAGRMIEGHFQESPVLLARVGDDVLAVGGRCTHYGAPLADGLLVGDEVRCPWHHACFSLRSGEALRAPALSPLPTYTVARDGGDVRVTGAVEQPVIPPPGARPTPPDAPAAIVIIGAGGAGNAAAEMLRRRGYRGPLTMIGADPDLPCDRPNLSKDYLAGNAPEDWIPLRSRDFYTGHDIDLILGTRVAGIDTERREVKLLGGRAVGYERLLIATGADPVRLPVPTHTLSHVFTLRSPADSRAIIAASARAKRAVVVGASFIGLEVAAALRTRFLTVDVVAPGTVPFEKVLGPDVGRFIQRLHEAHGVTFHMGETVTGVDARQVTLKSGRTLPADLVVTGIGVRPSVAIAQWAKLQLANGVLVNEYLETSRPGIFAAGDIAAWPDPHTGERIRVEHWVVAERQGQIAARNMLGERVPFDAVPFFWSAHYDVTIAYVGHHETWDDVRIDGSLERRDCTIEYRRRGRLLAVATIGRDRESLEAEVRMEAERRTLDVPRSAS